MQVVERNVVFRETDPASRSRYAAIPCLFKCPDGTLLLTERTGTHKNSADGAQRFWRSRDAGRTWQRQEFPFPHTPAGKPGEFRTLQFSQIVPGRIAMLLTWMDHPSHEPPLVNGETEGILPIALAWAESSDSGVTWSALRPIPVNPLVQPCGNGPVTRLPDGSLYAAFETYKPYDDPSPWSANACHVISRDDGKTWQSPKIVAADPEHKTNYWDQHLVILRDGTLLSVMWSDYRDRPNVSDIVFVKSSDGGKTWSGPRKLGVPGQFSCLLPMPDGRLLMFYVVRTGDPSIRARFGSPDGMTWDADDAMVLYSQADDDGKLYGNSFGDYLKSMGAWTFGWPSVIALSDQELLAAHYKADGDFSSTYVVRIQM